MTTFLFWNLMGNDRESWPRRAPNLSASLGRLAFGVEQRHPVDVVMLAECGFTPAEAVAALGGGFACGSGPRDRVQVFARGLEVADLFDDGSARRLAIKRLTARSGVEVLLACVHLPGALHHTADARARSARSAAAGVVSAERDIGHTRTVVVGDFNMNPYEPGMVEPDGFHAVMTREVAGRGPRTVDFAQRPYFYNPMWGLFGDRTPGPAGTHYYTGASTHVHWHLLDQVLLRPALMSALDDLRILDRDGRVRLVTEDGRPDDLNRSDHLPMLFRLDV